MALQQNLWVNMSSFRNQNRLSEWTKCTDYECDEVWGEVWDEV